MRLIDITAKTFPTPYRINNTEHANGWNSCLNSVLQQPVVDAVPVVHGHWLKNVLFYGTHTCSNCGKDPNHFEYATGYVEILSDYCPNCGAKMDR